MKKIFIALFIAVLCCFAGCSKAKSPNDNSSPTASQEESQEPTKINTPYTEDDLNSLLFTDTEKSLTVDVSANSHLRSLLLSVEYYADNSPDEQTATSKYSLALRGVELHVHEDGEIRFLFENGEEEQAIVLEDEFAYLDTLIDGNPLSLSTYTAEQDIQVYSASNASGSITDKAAFLAELQDLRLVKLNHKDHYQLGAKAYTLRLGDDRLSVYDKYVILNDGLYFIHQGDFDFLKDIEFSTSSDWLPWL